MFLIIEKDYTVSKNAVLSGHIRMRARNGEISVIDCKKMQGMNRPTYHADLGEWSDVVDYERPTQ